MLVPENIALRAENDGLMALAAEYSAACCSAMAMGATIFGRGFARTAHSAGHPYTGRSYRWRALGNGQVPRVVAAAWRILSAP